MFCSFNVCKCFACFSQKCSVWGSSVKLVTFQNKKSALFHKSSTLTCKALWSFIFTYDTSVEVTESFWGSCFYLFSMQSQVSWNTLFPCRPITAGAFDDFIFPILLLNHSELVWATSATFDAILTHLNWVRNSKITLNYRHIFFPCDTIKLKNFR